MADKKITELTAHTTVTDADVFAVVNSGTTKQITRANILASANISGTPSFSGDVTFQADVDIEENLTVTKDVLIADGNFTWKGRIAGATVKTQTAMIPISNYSIVDNVATRIIQFKIGSYDVQKSYLWGISFVFEGQIVATDDSSPAQSVQMYKCSHNVSIHIVNDAVQTAISNFSEDVEPTEANSNATLLKVYTTTATISYPNPEEIDFNLKCNFTGTEVGTATLLAHGIVRVFSHCRQIESPEYNASFNYSNNETA